MTKNARRGPWNAIVLAAVILPACVGRRGGGGSSESSESLVDSCSGTYSCSSPDGSFYIEPSPDGFACDIGGVLLLADGSIQVPDDPDFPAEDFRWRGDTNSFDVCANDGTGCIECDNLEGQEEPEDGEEEAGECTGYPASCSSKSAGSCHEIRGCYMHTVYGSDFLPSRYECRGSPHSCGSGFYSEDACLDQGCDWE